MVDYKGLCATGLAILKSFILFFIQILYAWMIIIEKWLNNEELNLKRTI